jgi:hypothetical protein
VTGTTPDANRPGHYIYSIAALPGAGRICQRDDKSRTSEIVVMRRVLAFSGHLLHQASRHSRHPLPVIRFDAAR